MLMTLNFNDGDKVPAQQQDIVTTLRNYGLMRTIAASSGFPAPLEVEYLMWVQRCTQDSLRRIQGALDSACLLRHQPIGARYLDPSDIFGCISLVFEYSSDPSFDATRSPIRSVELGQH
eukprot:TRINITY_DN1655_c0_g1_i9.p1 TRINITY_DN1655_c0_g1~~TRINITY_DN1655_c0_g1_i9.p1  ORF type:complete len:119 (-),score=14.38 TRINITY_DN1655_c0_g1_i9:350-706(-)